MGEMGGKMAFVWPSLKHFWRNEPWQERSFNSEVPHQRWETSPTENGPWTEKDILISWWIELNIFTPGFAKPVLGFVANDIILVKCPTGEYSSIHQAGVRGVHQTQVRIVLGSCLELVGGLVAINFIFPEILGFDYHPLIDELWYFSEGWQKTTHRWEFPRRVLVEGQHTWISIVDRPTPLEWSGGWVQVPSHDGSSRMVDWC